MSSQKNEIQPGKSCSLFPSMQDELEQNGYCLLDGMLSESACAAANKSLERVLKQQANGVLTSREAAYGIRNVREHWPEVTALLQEVKLDRFIQDCLGDEFGIVRVLFFDKPQVARGHCHGIEIVPLR